MNSVPRTETIYEALFDDAALARLPDVLTSAAKARSALMVWQHSDGANQTVAYNYFDDAWIAEYGAFANVDPYRGLALRPQNINRVFLPNESLSLARFERSVIYNEFVRKYNDDTVYCTGSGIRSAWGNGFIGVHRGRGARPFEKEDAARLSKVIVHVERVLRARGEMASGRRAAAMAQGALDALGLVILTVRADGRVLLNNQGAEKVFARADGLAMKDGCLIASAHEANKRLLAAVATATAPRNPMATALVIERGPDESAYFVTVTPLVGRIGESAALVLFRDPEISDNSLAGRLRSLFNLTNAEAAVAIDLANGLSIAQIASNRGVRITTLRTQLKGVGAKTGCARQSELVALLRRLPPISA